MRKTRTKKKSFDFFSVPCTQLRVRGGGGRFHCKCFNNITWHVESEVGGKRESETYHTWIGQMKEESLSDAARIKGGGYMDT